MAEAYLKSEPNLDDGLWEQLRLQPGKRDPHHVWKQRQTDRQNAANAVPKPSISGKAWARTLQHILSEQPDTWDSMSFALAYAVSWPGSKRRKPGELPVGKRPPRWARMLGLVHIEAFWSGDMVAAHKMRAPDPQGGEDDAPSVCTASVGLSLGGAAFRLADAGQLSAKCILLQPH